MIGPKHFEEFALPYIKEYNEKVLDLGFKTIFVHLCGEQNANLPFWAEIPMGDPGIISIGHEVELETAAKYFPITISKSRAGKLRSSSSVPCRLSSAQMLIVIAGMKTSMIYGKSLFS